MTGVVHVPVLRSGQQAIEDGRKLDLPPVFAVRGRGVHVTRNFLVYQPNGQPAAVAGLSHSPLYSSAAARLYPEIGDPLSGPSRRIQHPAVLVNGGPHGADSYFHWLLDYLPRLWVAERAGAPADAPIIVNADLAGYQVDTLEVFAPGRALVLKAADSVLECADLWAPSFSTKTGVIRPEVVKYLRRALDVIESTGGPRLVYLSRFGVPARKLPEENDLANALEGIGFAISVPHRSSFHTQVRLMAGARVIVCPHGGALANAVFAPPGAHLVEIATKPLHTAGPSIAAACGHRYTRVELGPDLVARVLEAARA